MEEERWVVTRHQGVEQWVKPKRYDLKREKKVLVIYTGGTIGMVKTDEGKLVRLF